MAVSEEVVLEPKSPSLINTDEWAIFSIGRVKVVSQDKGKPASLLSANKDHPVKVIGQLQEVEEEYQYLVRDPEYQSKTIEVNNVTTYAFAEYQDGSYGFWAAGKAGWFEFDSPAAAYQTIHTQMSEATSLLYFLADKLRRAVNQKPNLSSKELNKYVMRLFRDYFSQVGNPARFPDVEDVREAFHEHRNFLITCMLEGQEGLNWTGTPLYNYYKHRFPEEVQSLTSRVVASSTIPEPTMSRVEETTTIDQKKPESTHSSEPKPKKKGRPARNTPDDLPKTPRPKRSTGVHSVEEKEEDDDEHASSHIVRKRKSILRPSGGKSAKKARTAATFRKNGPGLDNGNDSADQDADDVTSLPDKSPITVIKNGPHLEQLTNPPSNRSSHDGSSGPRYLPHKYLEITVSEYEIPSTKPQGPGGLWTCTFEGCHARVHQAETEDGQERVKHHLRTHITNAQEKIDLAIDESRPYLPVNNLVRRLQAFAPLSGEEPAPDSIQRTFGPAIRRRY